MPRPNQPRSILGEQELARRVAFEREARGWTYEGLASRMTAAGCPIQPSAIYKIEKADPPRRITVDELIAFSAAFEVSVIDLLRPRELVLDTRLRKLFDAWEDARQESLRASDRRDEAFHKLAEFVQSNHADALEPFFARVREWAVSESSTEAEADVLHAMVMASAVPVEPFKKLERNALAVLKAERDES